MIDRPRWKTSWWLAFGTLFGCLDGQTLFQDVTATHVPRDESLHSLDAEFGDFDQDGDLDIAVAVENDVNRIYLNDGMGKFTHAAGRLSPVRNDTEDLTVADFDRDGSLDLVLVSEEGFVTEMYLGNGQGGFRDVSDRLPDDTENQAVTSADINGDGYPDLLVGNTAGGSSDGINRMYINLGEENPGFFRNETGRCLPNAVTGTQDIEFADLDGDGDLDIAMGNEVPPNRIWFNDGTGKFTEKEGALPELPPLETREVLPFDADGDGDIDLVYCNLTCNACNRRVKDPQVRLLLNDGEGNFTDATEGRLPENEFSSWDGGVLDFDGDGDPDLVIGAIAVPGFNGLQLRGYENDGRGKFTDATERVFPSETAGRSWDVEVADLNGDGKPDIFVGAWGTQARLLFGSAEPLPVGRGRKGSVRDGRGKAPVLRLIGGRVSLQKPVGTVDLLGRPAGYPVPTAYPRAASDSPILPNKSLYAREFLPIAGNQ